MNGTLYVVATPIGNLGDISFRTLEALKSVDLITCEDTRVTLKLLNHYEIKKPLVSFHAHSKIQKTAEIIGKLKAGQNVALVTDAGTPGISDPGGVLVAKAQKEGISVLVVPGPSALAAAISISGINLSEFVFLGFLPHKKGRQTKLKFIAKSDLPVILYESPHRIKKLLLELLENMGDQEIFIGRELTKKFEETYRDKISEILPIVKEKGEFVVIIESAHGKK